MQQTPFLAALAHPSGELQWVGGSFIDLALLDCAGGFAGQSEPSITLTTGKGARSAG